MNSSGKSRTCEIAISLPPTFPFSFFSFIALCSLASRTPGHGLESRLNALHGPEAGDRALRTLADTLTGSLRGHDVVGRTGSDELAALLPETDLAGALVVAERARAAVEAADLGAAGPITVSAGAVTAPRGASFDAVLAAAAQCLDLARGAGGDRVVAPTAAPGAPPEANVHQDVIDAQDML